MSYFINLISLGGMNSFIFYVYEFLHWNDRVCCQREQILEDYGLKFVQLLIKKRPIQTVGLQRLIQNVMSAGGINPAAEINKHEEEREKTKLKRRCYYDKSDRKASRTRKKCQRAENDGKTQVHSLK